jgi:hypothetical protein
LKRICVELTNRSDTKCSIYGTMLALGSTVNTAVATNIKDRDKKEQCQGCT